MVLDEVLCVWVLLWGLHLSEVTQHLASELGVLERQGLHALDDDEVRGRILALVETPNLVLLVHHLVLVLQLHEVAQPSVIVLRP